MRLAVQSCMILMGVSKCTRSQSHAESSMYVDGPKILPVPGDERGALTNQHVHGTAQRPSALELAHGGMSGMRHLVGCVHCPMCVAHGRIVQASHSARFNLRHRADRESTPVQLAQDEPMVR